jgi:aldehyde dehydrogenase (NAD+)
MEFSRAKSITRLRFALPVDLMSFARPTNAWDAVARVVGVLHGRHR